jgi:hypothetical protein
MAVLLIALVAGMAAAAERPSLLFREDFKETPAALPITQDHVANADMALSLHGPGSNGIKKSHHDQPADDPYYAWSGECKGNWAVSLRHRATLMDLRGQAKIRWRSKQSGFRQLRILLELEGNLWLVSDAADPASIDWREREFNVADIRWRRLNIATVTEGDWVANPDLSRVRSVGFTDLMAGGGSAASSRLDWIEVYCARAAPSAVAVPGSATITR